MEVKIPKEVRKHKESIFFGLSLRQFICSGLAVAAAAAAYLLLGSHIGQDNAGWMAILLAAPLAVAGFFSYNGMTFEQFIWEYIKTEILCSGERGFVSENIYFELISRKDDAFD